MDGWLQVCGRAVSLRIAQGQIVDSSKSRISRQEDGEGAVGIYLRRRKGGQHKPMGPITCTVTWVGEKEEPPQEGASHRCAERKGPVSPLRKEALDSAMERLGIKDDLEQLLASDQVSGILTYRKRGVMPLVFVLMMYLVWWL